MEEFTNATQAPKPKSHGQVWDVIGVLVSIGVIFFLVFLVMQINALDKSVQEQYRLTEGIKDKVYTQEPTQVKTEVHYVDQETFVNYVARRKDNASDVRFNGGPAGFNEIYRLQVDNCQAGQAGDCITTLFVYGRSNWQGIDGDQPFYLAEDNGLKIVFYGPYMDDLNKLMREAKHLKVMTDDGQ